MKTIIVEPFENPQPSITKEELLKELKKSLADEGFKKLSINRWEKNIGEFINVVYVQGDRFKKGDYDIRLGVIIANTPIPFIAEGHFTTDIPNFNTTYEEILSKIKQFFETWANKEYIIEYVTKRRKVYNELQKYSGEELKLKRKEFYMTYKIAVTNTDIEDYLLTRYKKS